MERIIKLLLVLGVWTSMASRTSAQTDSTTSPQEKTGSIPQGKNHVIKVGDAKAAKIFIPSTVEAKIGDLITFEFHPNKHTVSQSTFESPCTIVNGTQGQGFNSGLIPVKPQTEDSHLPRWTMQVLVPTPIWFFCNPHCGIGMVGAINPPKTGEESFDKFLEKAQKQGSKNARGGGSKEGEKPAARELASGTIKANSSQGPVSAKATTSSAATLQRGPPVTENELAALNVNSAALNTTKDSNTLSKSSTTGRNSNASQQQKTLILSLSFSILIPNLFFYLFNSNPNMY